MGHDALHVPPASDITCNTPGNGYLFTFLLSHTKWNVLIT